VNTDDETSPSSKLTDRQLDLLLAAANKEILQHIEAAANPTQTLTAIMAQNTGTNAVIQGATGASGPEAGQLRAALMIGIRSTTHRLVLGLAALYLGRAHNSALDCDFPLGSNSAPDPALDSDLAHAHALARALARVLDSLLDSPLNRAIALVHARALAVTVALDLDRARDFDRARALDRALDSVRVRALALGRARALDRRRDRALDRALDSALDSGRGPALAHALAQELARSIDAHQVDASGADLSEVRIEQLDALSGTIWTDQTIWPPDIEDQVRTHSEEIRPGVYQVRCGNEPDHSDLTSV